MIDLEHFVKPISRLSSKPHPYLVEVFGWYLHSVKGLTEFTTTDLVGCYDAVHLTRPGNIHGTLTQICGKKPARILRNAQGKMRLAAPARADMDRLLPLRPTSVQTTATLNALAGKVTNPAHSVFLNEALICFKNHANRAAIVMAWNLAWSHVCDRILALHEAAFNAQRHTVRPKWPVLMKRTDFEDYREADVIDICRGARIFDHTVCKVLKAKLDIRNLAAHPSSAVMADVTAEEVIHDLVANILLNPAV